MADDARFFTPNEEEEMQRFRAEQARRDAFRQTATPERGVQVAQMAATYPGMPPGAVLALGSAGIPPDSPVAQGAAQAAAKVVAKKKSWAHKAWNGTIRGAFTVATAPYQFIGGNIRNGIGIAKGERSALDVMGNMEDVALQTDLGQVLTAWRSGAPVKQGEGFFVNPTSEFGQRQRAATRQAAAIDGEGASLGRLIATQFYEPDDDAYRHVAGAIDLVTSLAADPTTYAGFGWSKIQNARRVFTPESAGMFQGMRKFKSLDDRAEQWLTSETGEKFAQWAAKNTDMDDIWKKTNQKWDADFAAKVADTKKPEEVKELLRGQIVSGKLREIPYRGAFAPWTPVGGVKRALADTATLTGTAALSPLGVKVQRRASDIRLLNAMPGVREGFVLDDINQSVKQLDLTLKNANLDRARIAEWNGKLARAESPEARRSVILNAFSDMTESVMKARGVQTTLLADDVGKRVSMVGLGSGKLQSVDDTARTAVVDFGEGGVKTVDLDELSKKTLRDQGAQSKVFRSMTQLFDETDSALKAFNQDEIGRDLAVRSLDVNGKPVELGGPQLVSELNYVMPGLKQDQIVALRLASTRFAPFIEKAGMPERAMRHVTQKYWQPLALLRAAYTVRVVGEEQVRLASSNMTSLINHPIAHLAVAIGDDKGRFAEAAKRVGIKGRLKTDAVGSSWDELSAEGQGLSAYGRARNRSRAGDDWQVRRSASIYIKDVRKDSDLYGEGLFDELLTLSHDPIARRVAGGFGDGDLLVRTGNDVDDTITWMKTAGGQKFLNQLSERRGWESIKESDDVLRAYVENLHGMVTRKTVDDADLKELIARGTVGGQRANAQKVRQLIEDKRMLDIGPESVKAPYNAIAAEQKSKWDMAIESAFDYLMVKPTNYLSRSPVFRTKYWQRIEEVAASMTTKDQLRMLENARKANLDPKQIQRLEQATKRGSGDIDLDAADTVAKAHGLDETQKLLYNPDNKSQLFDQLGSVFVFGDAWKEMATVWSKILADKPTVVATGQKVIEGGRDTGFLSTDANGRETFTIPLTGKINQAVTGTNAPFAAPLSGLNVFSSNPFLPGMNPFLSWPVSNILDKKPELEGIKKLIAPFGPPDTEGGVIEAFLPAWMRKLYTAGFDDPNSDRDLNVAVGQMARTKAQSGAYDMSSPEGKQKLLDDSIKSARLLFVLRGAAQFWSPSPPSPKWLATDKDGSIVTADKLTEAYRQYQDEDFDTATERFIEAFGEESLLYMQSLSEGGPAPTDVLHDWVRDNPDLAVKYTGVYGYFAPSGGEYSGDELERQIAIGEREQLTGQDMLSLGNARVARMKYNQARDSFGAERLTPEQSQWLKDYKVALRDDYPGYEPDSMVAGKRAERIRQLEDAADDEALAGNDVAQTLKTYIEARNQAKAELPGFAEANAGVEYREWLRDVGNALSAENPAFLPLWRDVLEPELKDDATDLAASAAPNTGEMI